MKVTFNLEQPDLYNASQPLELDDVHKDLSEEELASLAWQFSVIRFTSRLPDDNNQ